MKTSPINSPVVKQTINLPAQAGRPCAAIQSQSHRIEPDYTNSHRFADKTRALQPYCRHAQLILHRRRRGKIARLPEPIREQINLMLRDGLPYRAIIDKLGEAGKHLNKDNLSRWRKADHQDWLVNQTWLQAATHRPETIPELRDLTLLLHEMDPVTLQTTMASSPNGLVRIFSFAAKATALSAPAPHDKPSSPPAIQ